MLAAQTSYRPIIAHLILFCSSSSALPQRTQDHPPMDALQGIVASFQKRDRVPLPNGNSAHLEVKGDVIEGTMTLRDGTFWREINLRRIEQK